MNIIQSKRIESNKILFLPSAEELGCIPVNVFAECISENDPKRLRIGFVLFSRLGICIYNDYSVSMIEKIEDKK